MKRLTLHKGDKEITIFKCSKLFLIFNYVIDAVLAIVTIIMFIKNPSVDIIDNALVVVLAFTITESYRKDKTLFDFFTEDRNEIDTEIEFREGGQDEID